MKKKRPKAFFTIVASLLIIGGVLVISFSRTSLLSWLDGLTEGGRRILGWGKGRVFPEEKRIREEIILKRLEPPVPGGDSQSLIPRYPRPPKVEGVSEKERMKALRETPEFKELDKEQKAYLGQKLDSFQPELPVPSLEEWENVLPSRDRGTEKVLERLVSTQEKGAEEKPLEENLSLRIKGPLVARRILERPQPPRVKVHVETEIELTVWVLPDGKVDRAIPTVRADAELERIAIQYLKQWRFAPLPKDRPQAEQWGTIPIKFKLQ